MCIGINGQISKEFIEKILSYDPDTGVIRWIGPRSRGKRPDLIAGSEVRKANGKRYVQVVIQGRKYYAHRLIWVLVHGGLPDEDIDHINGDGTDNRLANLRRASRTENSRNMRRSSSNSSGYTGVTWHKKANAWLAQIVVGSKNIYLGVFKDIDSAVKARSDAEIRFSFHNNHGSDRPL